MMRKGNAYIIYAEKIKRSPARHRSRWAYDIKCALMKKDGPDSSF
jgi:hypothetical protein